MKKFTYGGREFEDSEELAEYIECCYDSDLCDAIHHYIFELLHEYTLELTDREEKGKLYSDIIYLMNASDFYDLEYDRETEDYDLEKAYADVTLYFKDPEDEKLFYAISCTVSPYEGYDLGDMRIFAAEKREIVVNKFFEIQKS
jgi:hypothetical protein